MARLAEEVGFDSLWTRQLRSTDSDTKARPRGGEPDALARAAITERVELGTLVLATGWRNPALLAKMADTVDEISGGRLILGLGAGYHLREYEAFGYPFDHRVSRFEEAITILHTLLRSGEIDYRGRFYSARDCELRPRGPRRDGPPLLIGTIKPRMLGLTARFADYWNAYYDDIHNEIDGLVELLPRVDLACKHAGRDPDTLGRTVTLLLADPSADPWWDRLPSEPTQGASPLVPLHGAPEELARSILEFKQAGVCHIQLCLEPTNEHTIAALAPLLDGLR